VIDESFTTDTLDTLAPLLPIARAAQLSAVTTVPLTLVPALITVFFKVSF
jgi:hypothetical protein